jgi:ribosome-binding factor A
VKYDKESAGHRHQRLETTILEELALLLRDDVSDPELEGVQFRAVVLSADYRSARVHFMVPASRSRAEVERALARATPFLRGRLAESIELKRAPDLRFVFDAEIGPGA